MARHGDGIYQRGKTWWLDFTFQKKRSIVRLGSHISRSVARDLAAVERAKILTGKAGIGGPVVVDTTWEHAVEEFKHKAFPGLRPRTRRTYAQGLAALTKTFAGHRLGEISPFLVEKHKHARIDVGVRVAVNRELSLLHALFTRCREWKLFTGDNPADSVDPLEESRGRLRVLDPEEERRLLEALPEPYRLLTLVGLDTGLRLSSEALSLTWGDVDLDLGVLTVQGAYTKNGETRSVPLTARLREALAPAGERKPAADAAVFTTR